MNKYSDIQTHTHSRTNEPRFSRYSCVVCVHSFDHAKFAQSLK